MFYCILFRGFSSEHLKGVLRYWSRQLFGTGIGPQNKKEEDVEACPIEFLRGSRSTFHALSTIEAETL